MVLVHDNDLAQLDGIYDGTVSRSYILYFNCVDTFLLAAVRISSTRCDVKLPPKLPAEDS